MKALFAILLLLAAGVYAQEVRPEQHNPGSAPTGPRVVTMTRPMAIFSGLESQLDAALAKGDQAALDKLVSDSFSLWTPAPPGDPIPREDWIQQVPGMFPIQRRQLAVEDLDNGNVDVVSYVATPATMAMGAPQKGAAKKSARHAPAFIVDVWKKVGDGYQLQARYQWEVSSYVPPRPKPTGKE